MKYFIIFILFIEIFVSNAFAQTSCQSSQWCLKGGTLSSYTQGWAWNADFAVDGSNNIYTSWTQHSSPEQNSGGQWDYSSIYVKKWNGSSWSALGGRIWSGSVGAGSGPRPEAFRSTIAVLGTTPYVAWYEGGGYISESPDRVRMFVAHYTGSAWALDYSTNGSVSTYNPRLAVINNQIYLGYYDDAVGYVVKSLSGGIWTQVGSNTNTFGEGKLFDVGGNPYIFGSNFVMYHLSGGAWTALTTGTPVSTGATLVSGIDSTIFGSTYYVVWSEKVGRTANSKVYLSHWNGSAWVNDGGVVNYVSTNDATYPSITNDGTNIWVSWEEGGSGVKPYIYTRYWNGSSWSNIEGPQNAISGSGSRSRMLMTTKPQIIWDEKNSSNNITRQIYIRGRGDSGLDNNDKLTSYGSNGGSLIVGLNSWTRLQAGGVANGSYGVGDEAFSSFRYDPITKRAYVFGKYHAYGTSSGEDQNALLAYTPRSNRWDVTEIGEVYRSEHINGHGHDSGKAAVDTIHGLWLNNGSLLSGFVLYIYDLVASRGKAMIPVVTNPASGDSPTGSDSSTQYDSEHDIFFMMGADGSGYPRTASYNRATNTWSNLTSSPPRGGTIVYDSKNHFWIAYTGSCNSTLGPPNYDPNPYYPDCNQSIYTWSESGSDWQLAHPTGDSFSSDWSGYVSIAYDSLNGVTLIVNSCTAHVWVYDAATNILKQLADIPSGYLMSTCDGQHTGPTGSYNALTYDPDDGIFLLHTGVSLYNILAFRYSPDGFVVGGWRPISAPYYLQNIKHMVMGYNSDNHKVYITAGDNHNGSYNQATYSIDTFQYVSTSAVLGYTEEYPQCGPGGGQMQPHNPDYGGFKYDARVGKKVFWWVAGNIDHSAVCGLPDDYGTYTVNGQTYVDPGGAIMTFDPVTKLWSHPISKSDVGHTAAQASTNNWDSILIPDKNVMLGRFNDGSNYFVEWNLTTGIGTLYNVGGNAMNGERGLMAADYDNRIVYFLDSRADTLYTYHMDTHTVTPVNTSVPALLDPGYCAINPTYCDGENHIIDSEPQIAYDPSRHLLFYGVNVGLWYGGEGVYPNGGFWAYHPDRNGTDAWEVLPWRSINGTFPVFKSMIYDPSIDAIFVFGGQLGDPPVSDAGINSLYFYRYSPSLITSDIQPPTIQVLTPTVNPTYQTTNNSINVSGNASDNVGVDHVTWSNNRSGGGNASGATSWSVSNIALQVGENILTFISYDAANNASRNGPCSSNENAPGCLTVTYNPLTINANILSGQVDLNGNARSN